MADHDTVADQIAAALQPFRDRLEAHQAARADALRQLDNVRFREQVGGSLIKAGARPQTLSYLLNNAAEYFEVVDDDVRAKPQFFSPSSRGCSLEQRNGCRDPRGGK